MLRFSLRSLLIAVTAACVVLGLAFGAPDGVVVVVIPIILVGLPIAAISTLARGRGSPRARTWTIGFLVGIAAFYLLAGWMFVRLAWGPPKMVEVPAAGSPGGARLEPVPAAKYYFPVACRIALLAAALGGLLGGILGAVMSAMAKHADRTLAEARAGQTEPTAIESTNGDL
jgi:hypothetical protein